ncbi:hypothetical protein HPB49_002704 [Dermacentor silvarum]|uniref:Uncharacterized protein n=1 Tax=Dermacentor silvarum TaxID=543639 RepID=A0ACB8DA85_DERSI|nr:hypothetical protein HPB49_002704 [Dermacentor silvarum]
MDIFTGEAIDVVIGSSRDDGKIAPGPGGRLASDAASLNDHGSVRGFCCVPGSGIGSAGEIESPLPSETASVLESGNVKQLTCTYSLESPSMLSSDPQEMTERRDGRPLVTGYALEGENFVAAPEELTTPRLLETITNKAKASINDVTERVSGVSRARSPDRRPRCLFARSTTARRAVGDRATYTTDAEGWTTIHSRKRVSPHSLSAISSSTTAETLIYRPPQGLRLVQIPPGELHSSLGLTSLLSEAELRSIVIRILPEGNIALLVCQTPSVNAKLLAADPLTVPNFQLAARIYQATPANTYRGVIHDITPKTSSAALMGNLWDPDSGILTARMMGSTHTALITLYGSHIPR